MSPRKQEYAARSGSELQQKVSVGEPSGRPFGQKPIRVGMIRCDLHAAWYALLMTEALEPEILKYYPACHYYFYYRHSRKFDIVPGFQITRLYDPFPPHGEISNFPQEGLDNAERFARAFPCTPRLCRTLDEVSDDVDMVFIADCLEEGKDHLALATPGLKKGIPTFVDKPFAFTLSDAREMVSLARVNRTVVFSCSLLRQNTLLDQFRSHFDEVAPVGEAFIKGVGRGRLGGAIHGLSMTQNLFGEGVEWVQCMGRTPMEVLHLHYPYQEGRKPDGCDVIALMGQVLGPACGHQCVVYGERKGPSISPWINDFNYPLGGQIILRMCREMVRTRQPPMPYESMLELLEIVEAARLSQHRGTAVSLDEVRENAETDLIPVNCPEEVRAGIVNPYK